MFNLCLNKSKIQWLQERSITITALTKGMEENESQIFFHIWTSHLQITFNAISKQAWRLIGRPKIKLQTAPRPWVTRSPSRTSFAEWLSEQHISSSSFKTESGKRGTSPRSLLKDLSVAGKASSKDFAYNTRSCTYNSTSINKSYLNRSRKLPTTPRRNFSYTTATNEECETASEIIRVCRW